MADDGQAKHGARPQSQWSRPLHHPSAINGYSRLAYTEGVLEETDSIVIGFNQRARASLAAHGPTYMHCIAADGGACYKPTRSLRRRIL